MNHKINESECVYAIHNASLEWVVVREVFALDLISMVTIVLWRVDPRRIVSNVVLHWKRCFQTRFFLLFFSCIFNKAGITQTCCLYRYTFHHLDCMVGLTWKDYMLKMYFSMEKMNGIFLSNPTVAFYWTNTAEVIWSVSSWFRIKEAITELTR